MHGTKEFLPSKALLTFCPPGPAEREKLSSKSLRFTPSSWSCLSSSGNNPITGCQSKALRMHPGRSLDFSMDGPALSRVASSRHLSRPGPVNSTGAYPCHAITQTLPRQSRFARMTAPAVWPLMGHPENYVAVCALPAVGREKCSVRRKQLLVVDAVSPWEVEVRGSCHG